MVGLAQDSEMVVLTRSRDRRSVLIGSGSAMCDFTSHPSFRGTANVLMKYGVMREMTWVDYLQNMTRTSLCSKFMSCVWL